MLRDENLIFLIFNVLIETEDNHVTSMNVLREKLNNFKEPQIMYHLFLMEDCEWVKVFSDGVRMTWAGHDHYDSTYVDDEKVDNEASSGVNLNIVE